MTHFGAIYEIVPTAGLYALREAVTKTVIAAGFATRGAAMDYAEKLNLQLLWQTQKST